MNDLHVFPSYPERTAETEFISREIVYTVRGEDGDYTFKTLSHHLGNLLALHTLSGMALVGIEGINGYIAPAISDLFGDRTFYHDLPSARLGF